jgi:hypothetical protein
MTCVYSRKEIARKWKCKRAHNLMEVVCIGCLQDRKGALLTEHDEQEVT